MCSQQIADPGRKGSVVDNGFDDRAAGVRELHADAFAVARCRDRGWREMQGRVPGRGVHQYAILE
jgi:hypothetical protein